VTVTIRLRLGLLLGVGVIQLIERTELYSWGYTVDRGDRVIQLGLYS
jgi:hypothetical protein